MNGPTRIKLYKIVSNRDGEFCRGCQALPWEKSLILEHRNNNPKDNRPENLQIMCRACNYVKNPRGGPLDQSENVSEYVNKSELEVSRTKEPLFRRFVCQRLNEERQVTQNDIINSGAEHVEISPVTAKRYLDKMCSVTGLLQRKIVVTTVVIEYKPQILLESDSGKGE
jgi:hypothetical protein